MELSYHFFQWLPNKYQHYFKYLTNPQNHLINFFDDSFLNILGVTSIFHYPTYTPLFEIYRTQTINDFLTLNHELAHGIFYQYETIKSQSNNHYFLLELEGYFFDFLSIEYLKEKKLFKSTTIKNLEYSNCLNALDSFVNFYLISFIIHYYRKFKEVDIKSITKFAIKNSILDMASFYHENNPRIDAKYALSYLTSLDLENIYKHDPEYAFYLFEKIRCNRTNDIISLLRLHNITFMDDNYQNLHNKLKELKLIP